MALVVESTSSGTNTLTAPTGITEGDLLVIIAGRGINTAPSSSGFTVAVSDTDGSGFNPQAAAAIMYKIATLADESETSYSVSADFSAMLRISGWTSGNPFFDTATSFSSTVERPVSQIVILAGADESPETEVFSYDSYSITSADSNPTWTEVVEANSINNSGDDLGGFGAYAQTNDTSDITGASTSETPGFASVRLIAVICEPQDSAGTTDLLAPSPSFFNQTARSDTNGTANLLATSPTFPDSQGRGTSPTQWTNESETTTTWTNEQK